MWGTIPTSLIGGWLVRYPSKCLEGRAKGRHSFDQVSQAKVLQEKGDGSGPAWVLRQETPNQRDRRAGRKQILINATSFKSLLMTFKLTPPYTHTHRKSLPNLHSPAKTASQPRQLFLSILHELN